VRVCSNLKDLETTAALSFTVSRLSTFSSRVDNDPPTGPLCFVSDFRGDTFRAVYTVWFPKAVYVLHVFQKKPKRGIATPKHEMELVERRLAQVVELEKRAGRT
jgi:Phage derived protein Gp49-like (DUF891)